MALHLRPRSVMGALATPKRAHAHARGVQRCDLPLLAVLECRGDSRPHENKLSKPELSSPHARASGCCFSRASRPPLLLSSHLSSWQCLIGPPCGVRTRTAPSARPSSQLPQSRAEAFIPTPRGPIPRPGPASVPGRNPCLATPHHTPPFHICGQPVLYLTLFLSSSFDCVLFSFMLLAGFTVSHTV